MKEDQFLRMELGSDSLLDDVPPPTTAHWMSLLDAGPEAMPALERSLLASAGAAYGDRQTAFESRALEKRVAEYLHAVTEALAQIAGENGEAR